MSRTNPKPLYWDATGERIVRLKVDGTYAEVATSASYLVYTALLTQSGTDAPVATVLENSIGVGTWVRQGLSTYHAPLPEATNINKVFIPGFGDYIGDATVWQPIHNGTGIIGWYVLYVVPTSVSFEFPTIVLQTVDEAGSAVDLSTLIGNGNLFLPDIRVYP